MCCCFLLIQFIDGFCWRHPKRYFIWFVIAISPCFSKPIKLNFNFDLFRQFYDSKKMNSSIYHKFWQKMVSGLNRIFGFRFVRAIIFNEMCMYFTVKYLTVIRYWIFLIFTMIRKCKAISVSLLRGNGTATMVRHRWLDFIDKRSTR